MRSVGTMREPTPLKEGEVAVAVGKLDGGGMFSGDMFGMGKSRVG